MAADSGRASVADLPGDLSLVARVAVDRGLLDPMGFVAAVTDDGTVAVTPGSAAAGRLGRLQPGDLVRVDIEGQQVAGEHPVPAEAALAVELLRGQPAGSTVIYASSPMTMRLAAVGRVPQPLSHTNAELVHGTVPLIRPAGMVLDTERAAAVSQEIGAATLAVIVGMGVVVRARSPLEALRRVDAVELLAKLTIAAAGLPEQLAVLTPQDADAIARSRPYEPAPSRDPMRWYRSLDPKPRGRTLADAVSGASDPADLDTAREQLAASARVLYAAGDLVEFFEHVSQRAPGQSDRFLMTAAADFAAMTAEDVGVVSTEGDCEPIDCRYPPAPFRWLHRDLLAARPDVNAIVHTHPVYGRLYALAGRSPVPWHRDGALAPLMIPTLSRPSLLFDPVDRKDWLAALGGGTTVHALHHGTDFPAARIQDATVAAIQHESLCRNDLLARQLGTPAPLPAETVDDVRTHGPLPGHWWDFYAAKLPALQEGG